MRATDAPALVRAVPLPAAVPALPPLLARRQCVQRYWYPVAREALLLWFGTRLALVLLTYVGVLFTLPGDPLHVVTPRNLLYSWNQFDSLYFYLPIAANGYHDTIQAGFFPVYPALVHVVWSLTGQHHLLLSGLIVSNVACLAAFMAVGLFGLAEDARPAVVLGAIRLLAFSPFAFFLAAPYSMSLLVTCVAIGLLAARVGWWFVAAPALALATLTQPIGCLLALPLLWEFGAQHGWWRGVLRAVQRAAVGLHRLRTGQVGVSHMPRLPRPHVVVAWLLRVMSLARWRPILRMLRRAVRPSTPLAAVLVTIAAPAALWAYMAYCAATFHDPLAFAHAQARNFDHLVVGPWTGLGLLIENVRSARAWTYTQARILADALPLVAALVLGSALAVGRWGQPVAFTLLVLAIPLLLLAEPVVGTNFTDTSIGAGRYLLAALPLYLQLARWGAAHPALGSTLLYGGAMLQSVFCVFFLGGNWIV